MMRMAPRLAILGILAAGAVFQPSSNAGPPSTVRPPAGTGTRATVEPTPPLFIDLRLDTPDPAVRSGHGVARVVIEIDAGPDLREVTLRLVLPEEVQAIDDPLPIGSFALPAGARRTWETMVFARRAGSHALQVEATYRIGDGEILRTRQGTLLRAGGPSEGRHHAGAWEVQAVAIEDEPR